MKNGGVIFLLENSTDYLFNLDQAFRKAGVQNPLRVARYGNEAILYLKGTGIYSDRLHYPLPKVFLLDLTIPDGSAMTVLGWIRRQPEFDRMPIVILAGSKQEKLARKARDRGPNVSVVDRDDLTGLVEMIRQMRDAVAAPVEMNRTSSSEV